MRTALLLFVLCNTLYITYAQGLNNPISEENLTKRGYAEFKFLFSVDKVSYYTVKNEKEMTFIAIHDISEDDLLLDAELVDIRRYKENILLGPRQHNYYIEFGKTQLSHFQRAARKFKQIIEEDIPIAKQDSKSRKDSGRTKLFKMMEAIHYNENPLEVITVKHFVKDIYIKNKVLYDDGSTSLEDVPPIAIDFVYNAQENTWDFVPALRFYSKEYYFNTAKQAKAHQKIEDLKYSNPEKYKSIVKERRRKEQEKLKEEEILLRVTDENNPSELILKIDNKPKGKRYETNKAVFGEAYEKLNNLVEAMRADAEDSGQVIVLNAKEYFENIFYGEFSKLSPRKTNRNMFGHSTDYFPNFHNAFLYYANKKFGNKYFPNMTTKTFKMERTKVTEDATGNKIFNPAGDKLYMIFLPVSHYDKFDEYLDKNQFSIYSESFYLEFEYLMLSFFENYDPTSKAFKQMMQNLYRYSKGLRPVSVKDNLMAY